MPSEPFADPRQGALVRLETPTEGNLLAAQFYNQALEDILTCRSRPPRFDHLREWLP